MALRRQRSASYDTIIPANVLSVKDISKDLVEELLIKTDEMRSIVRSSGGCNRLQNRILATLFYEPSTRTHCSFQAAMFRLGGSVINLDHGSSSAVKGESLEDTIQTMSCYCDCIVIRHPQKGSSLIAANVSTKPIINAGDGTGEHPTQALLDIYTIKSELGYIGINNGEKMNVTLLGDLKNGRTVHSLVRLLSLFPGIKLIYVSPESLSMPEDIMKDLESSMVPIEQVVASSIEEVISITDVLYVTRIQKERFNDINEYNSVANSYVVNSYLMKKAKHKMIVMHPLPRNNEISTDIDNDPRAAYFRQMENGMFMRMALLELMMKKNEVEI